MGGVNGLSFIHPNNNSSIGNMTINQTIRNFNTITHELEKINEQIGPNTSGFPSSKQPAIYINEGTTKTKKSSANQATA